MQRIVRARVDLGLSVNAAAEKIGVAQPTLARAERGGKISESSAKLIADFYGLKASDIWDFGGNGAA